MAKNFNFLQARISAEARARSERRAEAMIQDMTLADLREAQKLTQEQLAKKLHMRQAAVSKLERRTNMNVTTLRHMIEKMGGELEIRAQFPQGDVRITQFSPFRRAKAGPAAD